jgi:hypothetical protein
VSVVADNPKALADCVFPVIALQFEIEVSLLVIHCLGLASFLLISPDEATATIILSNDQLINLSSGRLHVMRWSCFLTSSTSVLPSIVEVELTGIPAHAWELDTAAQLFSDCCLPCGVHPMSDTQREVFRLAAIDLEIPEPEVATWWARERHCLLYPILIAVKPQDGSTPDDAVPPPPPPVDDDHQ